MPKEERDKALYEKAKRLVNLKQLVLWSIVANIVCWAIYLITQPDNMWPVWVTLGTGIAIIASYLQYYSTDSVEQEYEKMKKKQ